MGGAVLDMQYELYECCSVLGDVDVAKLPSVFLFIYHRVRMGIVLLLATCIALRFYKDYKREVALLVAFLLSERNVFSLPNINSLSKNKVYFTHIYFE